MFIAPIAPCTIALKHFTELDVLLLFSSASEFLTKKSPPGVANPTRNTVGTNVVVVVVAVVAITDVSTRNYGRIRPRRRQRFPADHVTVARSLGTSAVDDTILLRRRLDNVNRTTHCVAAIGHHRITLLICRRTNGEYRVSV